MRLIETPQIKTNEDTFRPELHVTIALPMELASAGTQTDPQKFYEQFFDLLKTNELPSQ